MTSISSRAHLSNYKYAIKIIEDCRDIWLQEQFPILINYYLNMI